MATALPTDLSPIAVGMSVRAWRLTRGRSVVSVLQATGLNVSVYSRIETGSRPLGFSEAVMLANELGVSLQQIADLAQTFEASGETKTTRQQRRDAVENKIPKENACAPSS